MPQVHQQPVSMMLMADGTQVAQMQDGWTKIFNLIKRYRNQSNRQKILLISKLQIC